jgi:uncharacterized repeat protein (TIGR03803 family)
MCSTALALVCAAGLAGIAGSASAATYHIVYTFQDGPPDGDTSTATLINVGGILYGTTVYGGNEGINVPTCPWKYEGCGTVFSVNPATGVEHVVYAFQGSKAGGSDGASPYAPVINIGNTLYGTTNGGGSRQCKLGCGTLFSLNLTSGAETVLHAFRSGTQGYAPGYGTLISGPGGKLYGTTENGGSTNCYGGCGTVYSLSPSTGAEKLVYSFVGGSDGANPQAGLIKIGTTLYGTTRYGGGSTNCSGGCGTVYSLNPSTGAVQVVYAFNGSDGATPLAPLLNIGGMLYGTSLVGGAAGNGTVFALNPSSGSETVLHSFLGGSDGGYPSAGVINLGGKLYGTTSLGGGATNCDNGCGIVYSLSRITGVEKILYAFQNVPDGASPNGLIAIGGTLYGTTSSGGTGFDGGGGIVRSRGLKCVASPPA